MDATTRLAHDLRLDPPRAFTAVGAVSTLVSNASLCLENFLTEALMTTFEA